MFLVVLVGRSRLGASLFDTAPALQRKCLQKKILNKFKLFQICKEYSQVLLGTSTCCLLNLSSPTELSSKSTGVGEGELGSNYHIESSRAMAGVRHQTSET